MISMKECVVLCCIILFRDIEQCRIIINIHFGDSQFFENDLNDLKGFKMEIPSSTLRF